MTRAEIRLSIIARIYCIDDAKRRLRYKPLVSMEEGMERAGKSFAKYTQMAK